jgi:hypothetical protein
MISLHKHIASIINLAAIKAMPELTEKLIASVEKNKDWEYSSPSPMTIFNKFKSQGSFGHATCQSLA